MRYLFQFGRILAFCFIGEVLHAVLPLPVPASVYGLLLLLLALCSGIVRLEQVRETGLFLTGIFPLLFVPAAAGVMELWAELGVMLLPATASLVIPLYEKLDLLRKNAAAILAGIASGTLLSLGSAFALALVLKLNHVQYVTLLPKSVATAISMDVSSELGGIASLTGAIVILTGIVGNLLAENICKWFHITDPIAFDFYRLISPAKKSRAFPMGNALRNCQYKRIQHFSICPSNESPGYMNS